MKPTNQIAAAMVGLAAMGGSTDYLSDIHVPSMTAGVNKYAKNVSNADALTDDEKRRNAEIDAKIAAKKAAKKGK
jgi:hypothetical protein